jgi:tellurite resistance protein TerC
MTAPIIWLLFGAAIVALLLLDLLVAHRSDEEVGLRRALWWSAGWISLGLAFGAGVWLWRGGEAAQQYFAAFVIEKSLSVDNLFVFVVVFSGLGIAAKYQYKVLFWGILGAIVFRLFFILGGIALLERFHWVVYVFGGFLLVTAFKMWRGDQSAGDPKRSRVVRLAERLLPIDSSYQGAGFTYRRDGRTVFTGLALALIAVESADLVFAVDSVPAVLAVSNDPFIVFSSNVFAILGLRSLYFALAGCVRRFHYLHYGLALVLGFVGAKMLLADLFHVPISLSIAVIFTTVAGSVVYSLWKTRGILPSGGSSSTGDVLEPQG